MAYYDKLIGYLIAENSAGEVVQMKVLQEIHTFEARGHEYEVSLQKRVETAGGDIVQYVPHAETCSIAITGEVLKVRDC